MLPSDVFDKKKVAIFLPRDTGLAEAIRGAGARDVAIYGNGPASPDQLRLTYRTAKDVGRNNADIVLLEGRSAMALRSKDLKHIGGARLLLVRASARSFLAGLLLLNHLRRGRLAWRGQVMMPPAASCHRSRWLVFENVARKQRSAKYYAALGRGIVDMFSSVADLRYSTLRSAQKIRDPSTSGDIDLLVHNDDAGELVRRMTERFGTIPLDVYTPFSVPGHSDGNVAYLPPARALDLLSRRERGEWGEWHPCPADALLSYCYHLLFHRQPGVLGKDETLLPKTWDDEARFAELMRLCDKAGVARVRTLSDMEALLRREKWFPESETINFVARSNEFVRSRYAVRSSYLPGLAVFIVREAALKYELVGPIETILTAEGFDIKLSEMIPVERRIEIASLFRGGNWASSQDSEPAGVPAHFIVTFDPNPLPMPEQVEIGRAFVDNKRLLLKKKLRKRTAQLADKKRLNALHSSDNSLQALDYVRLLCPDRYDEFEALVLSPSVPGR
ncbi:hypothetical protein NKH41_28640 [Mesorhizobium sp. M1169]|uniref:hypothetical protein n=2 Tax=Mesorhizobium TaxID=68287 RepID=UPI003338136C